MTTSGMLAARQLVKALAGARQSQLHSSSLMSAHVLAPLSSSALRLLHSTAPSFHAALPQQQTTESSSTEASTPNPASSASTSSTNPRTATSSRTKPGLSPAAASAAAEQLLKSFESGFTQAKAAYQAAATAASDATAAANATATRASSSSSSSSSGTTARSTPASSAAPKASPSAASAVGGEDSTAGSSSSDAGSSAGAGSSTASSSTAGAEGEAAGSSAGSSSTDGAGAGASSESTSGSDQQQAGSGAGSGRSRVQAGKDMFTFVAKEVRDTLSSASDIRSATRKYDGPLASEAAPYAGTDALVHVKVKATGWQRMFDAIREKLPFISKIPSVDVSGSAPFRKGREFAEDLKDRWETSDHPVVHKVEDMKARVFTGSEASRAMAEVRLRDANFDMNRFVQSVKLDAPGVTRAFLRHDIETLTQHCGTELLERFRGIFKHFADQGLFEDPTILFVGDVEIVEVRWVDEDPFIIAQFHCQQLKCTRDKFGNVVDGSGETIQRVYYFWGLQMEKDPIITAEGEVLPPRWVIKDMMWQSMLALV